MPDPSSSSSLTVLGGPLAGARVDLDQAVDEVLIGSDPDCQLVLDLPGVSPIHARVWRDQSGTTVHDTKSPRGIWVNDDRVVDQRPLRDGDVLWLGPPGDHGSVMIQCRLPGQTASMGDQPIEEFLVDESPGPAQPEEEPESFFVEPTETPRAAGVDAQPVEEFLVDETVAQSLPQAIPAPLPSASPVPPTLVDEQPADDVFFVEEPLVPPAPSPAPAVPAQPEPEEDLFFLAETPVPPAPAPPRPTPAPPPAPPAAAPPAPPRPAAPPPPMAQPPRPPVAVPPVPPKPVAAPPAKAAPPTAAQPPTMPAAAPVTPPSTTPAAAKPATAPRRAEPSTPATARPRGVASAQGRLTQPPRRKSGPPVALYAGVGVVALLVLGGGGFFLMRSRGAPKLGALAPGRTSPGQTVTVTGAHFAADPAANVVLFGDKPGRTLKASATELDVEVPDMALTAGQDTPVPLRVQVGGRSTDALEITVYQAPRIHGLSPDVAMPGEEIALAGKGWGKGAQVRFGTLDAEVLEVAPASIRVRVPALEGPAGTQVQVFVGMGSDISNAAPFVMGRLPLVSSVAPETAAPGDLLTVTGRGFSMRPRDILVLIGGVHALVVSGTNTELRVVVPRVSAEGRAPVEIRVRDFENPGEGSFALASPAEIVDMRFVAEPFADDEGHDHAVLATELGPAFVLSGSAGRSAAERAHEAQGRLNAALVALKASRDAGIEVRNVELGPSLGLVGKADALIEVTSEDAAAYDEDWTKQGGKGGPVTRARLAIWWGAVARDLVLLLVRSEKPHFAAELAPEGRVLGDVFQAARKAAGFGVPRKVALESKPAVREALRVVGFRVPAAVTGGPATALSTSAAVAATLQLDGIWGGTEVEGGTRKNIGITFSGRAGAYTFGAGVASLPLMDIEQPSKGNVRFGLQIRGATRHYDGKWDGDRLAGTISSDASGRGDIGTFEIRKAR
jgi:hypothetical protein